MSHIWVKPQSSPLALATSMSDNYRHTGDIHEARNNKKTSRTRRD